ncbi:MAG: uroporphyrinogen-III C-methyltransferase [Granulosicoccaceae bacterium]|jgi:uroporphyrin-3 C-methyltransferase
MSDENRANQPEQDDTEAAAEETLAEEEQALEEKVSPPESATNQKPRSTVASLLAGLALLVAIAAAGGVAWLWQLSQQEATATQSRIAALRDSTRQDMTALTGRLDALVARQSEVASAQATLATSLQSLYEEIGRDRSAWAVAETAYYLELANARLQLLRDAPTALQALRIADNRLQSLGDPAFIPVREQLASEIAALEALPTVDLTGAALALGGLAAQIPGLPLHAPASTARTAADTAAVADTGTPPADDTPRWREEAAKIWAVMRELVQVRRTDKRIEPLLSPDEQRLLIANLQLQLQTARYAVLARDTQLLHDSVGTARDWLLHYYDQDAAATRAVVERLDELGKLELAPALPDISAALRQLRSISNGKPST